MDHLSVFKYNGQVGCYLAPEFSLYVKRVKAKFHYIFDYNKY